MADIIREDVVSVGFDVDLKDLNDLQKELNNIKKMLLGDMGDDTFDGLGESADDAKEDIEKLTKENKELREHRVLFCKYQKAQSYASLQSQVKIL